MSNERLGQSISEAQLRVQESIREIKPVIKEALPTIATEIEQKCVDTVLTKFNTPKTTEIDKETYISQYAEENYYSDNGEIPDNDILTLKCLCLGNDSASAEEANPFGLELFRNGLAEKLGLTNENMLEMVMAGKEDELNRMIADANQLVIAIERAVALPILKQLQNANGDALYSEEELDQLSQNTPGAKQQLFEEFKVNFLHDYDRDTPLWGTKIGSLIKDQFAKADTAPKAEAAPKIEVIDGVTLVDGKVSDADMLKVYGVDATTRDMVRAGGDEFNQYFDKNFPIDVFNKTPDLLRNAQDRKRNLTVNRDEEGYDPNTKQNFKPYRMPENLAMQLHSLGEYYLDYIKKAEDPESTLLATPIEKNDLRELAQNAFRHAMIFRNNSSDRSRLLEDEFLKKDIKLIIAIDSALSDIEKAFEYTKSYGVEYLRKNSPELYKKAVDTYREKTGKEPKALRFKEKIEDFKDIYVKPVLKDPEKYAKRIVRNYREGLDKAETALEEIALQHIDPKVQNVKEALQDNTYPLPENKSGLGRVLSKTEKQLRDLQAKLHGTEISSDETDTKVAETPVENQTTVLQPEPVISTQEAQSAGQSSVTPQESVTLNSIQGLLETNSTIIKPEPTSIPNNPVPKFKFGGEPAPAAKQTTESAPVAAQPVEASSVTPDSAITKRDYADASISDLPENTTTTNEDNLQPFNFGDLAEAEATEPTKPEAANTTIKTVTSEVIPTPTAGSATTAETKQDQTEKSNRPKKVKKPTKPTTSESVGQRDIQNQKENSTAVEEIDVLTKTLNRIINNKERKGVLDQAQEIIKGLNYENPDSDYIKTLIEQIEIISAEYAAIGQKEIGLEAMQTVLSHISTKPVIEIYTEYARAHGLQEKAIGFLNQVANDNPKLSPNIQTTIKSSIKELKKISRDELLGKVFFKSKLNQKTEPTTTLETSTDSSTTAVTPPVIQAEPTKDEPIQTEIAQDSANTQSKEVTQEATGTSITTETETKNGREVIGGVEIIDGKVSRKSLAEVAGITEEKLEEIQGSIEKLENHVLENLPKPENITNLDLRTKYEAVLKEIHEAVQREKILRILNNSSVVHNIYPFKLFQLGNILQESGNLKAAITAYRLSFVSGENTNSVSSIINLHENENLADTNLTSDLVEKIIIVNALKDVIGFPELYAVINGFDYLKKKNHVLFQELITSCLAKLEKIVPEEVQPAYRIRELYTGIGNIYQELGQYDDAIKAYKQSLRYDATYSLNTLNKLPENPNIPAEDRDRIGKKVSELMITHVGSHLPQIKARIEGGNEYVISTIKQYAPEEYAKLMAKLEAFTEIEKSNDSTNPPASTSVGTQASESVSTQSEAETLQPFNLTPESETPAQETSEGTGANTNEQETQPETAEPAETTIEAIGAQKVELKYAPTEEPIQPFNLDTLTPSTEPEVPKSSGFSFGPGTGNQQKSTPHVEPVVTVIPNSVGNSQPTTVPQTQIPTPPTANPTVTSITSDSVRGLQDTPSVANPAPEKKPRFRFNTTTEPTNPVVPAQTFQSSSAVNVTMGLAATTNNSDNGFHTASSGSFTSEGDDFGDLQPFSISEEPETPSAATPSTTTANSSTQPAVNDTAVQTEQTEKPQREGAGKISDKRSIEDISATIEALPDIKELTTEKASQQLNEILTQLSSTIKNAETNKAFNELQRYYVTYLLSIGKTENTDEIKTRINLLYQIYGTRLKMNLNNDTNRLVAIIGNTPWLLNNLNTEVRDVLIQNSQKLIEENQDKFPSEQLQSLKSQMIGEKETMPPSAENRKQRDNLQSVITLLIDIQDNRQRPQTPTEKNSVPTKPSTPTGNSTTTTNSNSRGFSFGNGNTTKTIPESQSTEQIQRPTAQKILNEIYGYGNGAALSVEGFMGIEKQIESIDRANPNNVLDQRLRQINLRGEYNPQYESLMDVTVQQAVEAGLFGEQAFQKYIEINKIPFGLRSELSVRERAHSQISTHLPQDILNILKENYYDSLRSRGIAPPPGFFLEPAPQNELGGFEKFTLGSSKPTKPVRAQQPTPLKKTTSTGNRTTTGQKPESKTANKKERPVIDSRKQRKIVASLVKKRATPLGKLEHFLDTVFQKPVEDFLDERKKKILKRPKGNNNSQSKSQKPRTGTKEQDKSSEKEPRRNTHNAAKIVTFALLTGSVLFTQLGQPIASAVQSFTEKPRSVLHEPLITAAAGEFAKMTATAKQNQEVIKPQPTQVTSSFVRNGSAAQAPQPTATPAKSNPSKPVTQASGNIVNQNFNQPTTIPGKYIPPTQKAVPPTATPGKYVAPVQNTPVAKPAQTVVAQSTSSPTQIPITPKEQPKPVEPTATPRPVQTEPAGKPKEQLSSREQVAQYLREVNEKGTVVAGQGLIDKMRYLYQQNVAPAPAGGKVEDNPDWQFNQISCGPVSVAMIMDLFMRPLTGQFNEAGFIRSGELNKTLDRHYQLLNGDPKLSLPRVDKMDGLFSYMKDGDGTNIEYAKSLLQKLYFKVDSLGNNLSNIENALKQNKPVLFSIKGTITNYAGKPVEQDHILVAEGVIEYQGKKYLQVNDPANNYFMADSKADFSTQEIIGGNGALYPFDSISGKILYAYEISDPIVGKRADIMNKQISEKIPAQAQKEPITATIPKPQPRATKPDRYKGDDHGSAVDVSTLPVKYVHQLFNGDKKVPNGEIACYPATALMLLEYYGLLPYPDAQRPESIQRYLTEDLGQKNRLKQSKQIVDSGLLNANGEYPQGTKTQGAYYITSKGQGGLSYAEGLQDYIEAMGLPVDANFYFQTNKTREQRIQETQEQIIKSIDSGRPLILGIEYAPNAKTVKTNPDGSKQVIDAVGHAFTVVGYFTGADGQFKIVVNDPAGNQAVTPGQFSSEGGAAVYDLNGIAHNISFTMTAR